MVDYERQFGLGLVFEPVFLQYVLNYICFAHTNFAVVQDSKRSPREIALGERVKTDSFALFGSKVLAEIPDSLRTRNPNLPRFVPASFLHPQFNSMGSLVAARIRVGVEMIRRVFVAKSLKLCFPITVVNDVGLFVPLVDERSGLPVGLKLNLWTCCQRDKIWPCLRRTAFEVGWRTWDHTRLWGCKSIEVSGTRKGKNHSKGCCERFWNWMKAQAIEQPRKAPEKVPDFEMHKAPQEDKYMNPILKNPNPIFLANWKWFWSTRLVPTNHFRMMLTTSWEPVNLFLVQKRGLRSLLLSHRRKGSGTPEGVLHANRAWRPQAFGTMLPAKERRRARQKWRSVIQSQMMRSWRDLRKVSQWTLNLAVWREQSAALINLWKIWRKRWRRKWKGPNRECLRCCKTWLTSRSWQLTRTSQLETCHCFPLSLQPMRQALWCLLEPSTSEFGNPKPEASVDDTTLKELSGESTLLRMRKEIQNCSPRDWTRGVLNPWMTAYMHLFVWCLMLKLMYHSEDRQIMSLAHEKTLIWPCSWNLRCVPQFGKWRQSIHSNRSTEKMNFKALWPLSIC